MIDKSSLFFMITVFVVVAVVLVFAMKYYTAGRISGSDSRREAELKALADKAGRNHEEISSTLQEIRAETRELAGRVASIEKLLKEVG